MQKLNCHLQKSERELLFTIVQNHCPEDRRGATYEEKNPSCPARGTLSTTWKQTQICYVMSFKFKHSVIHIHPSFVQQTLRAGTHWLWATGKESEPWPDLPSPGAWSPSKQMKKGHDLILTQQSRQWASESPSKALSFPQDQTAGREAISILDKNRKNGAFDGLALTHWSTAGGAHQTQALSDLKLCCPQKKRTSVTFLDTTSLRLPL